MTKISKRSLLALMALASLPGITVLHADVGVVTPLGQQLAGYLDSFQVQHWWPTIPVNWQTGSQNTPTPPAPNTTLTGTHCSDFTTAAAWPLGIYILRPPIYPGGWNDMANYQDLWFKTNSQTPYGWLTISNSSTNGIIAQDLANQGYLVIASYLNPDINDSGHTAVVHPYSNTVANIMAVGPEECQAGTYNYNLTNIATGFNEHPDAFPSNINYFYHPVTYPITPVNPVLSSVAVSNGILTCQVSSLAGRNYLLQTTTDFTNWTTALTYVNPNNVTNLFTTTNLAVTAPQTCLFGVRVSDPYGIVSQVVTQNINFTGIILNGSLVTNLTIGSAFVDPGATAIENCSTVLALTTNGSVNTNLSGSYTLTYTATTSGGSQLTATRTVNVIGFILSYETSLTSTNWLENFDELGVTTNKPLPAGWVFAQGTFLPVYSNPLNAAPTFSTDDPQSWTSNLTSDQNSQLFTRCSDANQNATLTSGGRVNCGDASTGNTNRAAGFATSNPSWESPTNFLMFGFVNNIATNPIVSATLNYNIKRYKQGTFSPAGVAFYYSTNGATWTPAVSGDVGPYPASSTTTNYLFTTAAEVSNRTVNLSGLNVAVGSPLYFCWQFTISGPTGGQSATEHILALDDFNLMVSNTPPATIPAPLLLNTGTDSGGNYIFSWNAVTGTSYQVQFCTDLSQPDWINFGGTVLATNSTAIFSDPPAEDVYQRFYRVIPISPP